MCRTTPPYLDRKIGGFLKQSYTRIVGPDGKVKFRNDAGWICAQRRVGRALGWLNHQYTDLSNTDTAIPDMELPNMLIIVDDDTFVVR